VFVRVLSTIALLYLHSVIQYSGMSRISVSHFVKTVWPPVDLISLDLRLFATR